MICREKPIVLIHRGDGAKPFCYLSIRHPRFPPLPPPLSQTRRTPPPTNSVVPFSFLRPLARDLSTLLFFFQPREVLLSTSRFHPVDIRYFESPYSYYRTFTHYLSPLCPEDFKKKKFKFTRPSFPL